MPPDELVHLGLVGRAHGLRGAFYVSGRDEPIAEAYETLLIGPGPEALRRGAIERSGELNGRPILKCTLADDRTAAEGLTGQKIYVERFRMEEVDEDELHWADLEGVDVKDAAGQLIGTIDHVYNAGASDIVAVVGPDGRTVDIPLIEDYLDFDEAFDDDEALRLKVGADFFADLWQEARR